MCNTLFETSRFIEVLNNDNNSNFEPECIENSKPDNPYHYWHESMHQSDNETIDTETESDWSEDSDWDGARGMVTDFLKSDYIEKGKLNMKECQGYLCGPPPMIDAAIKEFTAEGMPNEEIFFDKFLDSGSK